MAVERIKNDVVFTCDACGDTLETDTDDFEMANAVRRENNWSATPVTRGSWRHECPDCGAGARMFD